MMDDVLPKLYAIQYYLTELLVEREKTYIPLTVTDDPTLGAQSENHDGTLMIESSEIAL